MSTVTGAPRYQDRIDALRATKLEQTRQKQERGPIDTDDKGFVLPPEDFEFEVESSHPSGGFFGPSACGKNFRRLVEAHPAYIDPMSSLAGAWMIKLEDYRKLGWHPEFDYSHLHADQRKYNIIPGIGGVQHFCPDVQIGLDLGWQGMREKIRRCRAANPDGNMEFYDALEGVVLGVQSWISLHVDSGPAGCGTTGRSRSQGES
jgi:hypothetical protein